MTLAPEQRARQEIDTALRQAGWIIQDRAQMNLSAGPGVAVREFRMASGHGFADYLLFVVYADELQLGEVKQSAFLKWKSGVLAS